MAAAGRDGGGLWMLLVTRRTISIPALMGAINVHRVATSNSILVVPVRERGAEEKSSTPRRRTRPGDDAPPPGDHDALR